MIIPRDIASGPAVLDFGSGMIRKDVASISTRPRSTIVVDAYSDSGYDQHTGFASNSHIEQRIVGQQPVITKGTVASLTNECTTTKSVYFYTLHIIEDIHQRFFDPRAREFCSPICLQTSTPNFGFLRHLSTGIYASLNDATIERNFYADAKAQLYKREKLYNKDDPEEDINMVRKRSLHEQLALEGEPNSGANGNRHNFYSTFHKTPNRKKFSEEEWEEFTVDSTR